MTARQSRREPGREPEEQSRRGSCSGGRAPGLFLGKPVPKLTCLGEQGGDEGPPGCVMYRKETDSTEALGGQEGVGWGIGEAGPGVRDLGVNSPRWFQ